MTKAVLAKTTEARHARRTLSRRALGALAGGTALTALLANPRPSRARQDASSTPVSGGSLAYARNIDTKTLDPHFSAQWSERYMLYCLYDTLVSWDTDFTIIPALAESWEIATDGKAITFSLHPDVLFHDGTPCDAEAVKWNLERVLDPDTGSNQRGQLDLAIDSVTAHDPVTLEIALKRPWRPLLAALGERPGFIISPTAAEAAGEEFARTPVGSGPFRFVEWVADSHITLERNPDYWDAGKPYLDRIEMRHVPDAQVQMTMLRTGEAQLIDEVDAGVVETLTGDPAIRVENYDAWRWYGLRMDVDKAPFDDRDLRRALSFATDRETIKQLLFSDQARVMTHPIAGGWAYDASLDTLMQYDLEQAQSALASAGGPPPDLLTLTTDNSQLNQDICQVAQAQYQELGVNVEIQTIDSAEYFAAVLDDEVHWGTTNWTPRADPDGTLRPIFYSTGFQNSTGYSNPEVDRLLDEAAGIYDTEEAAQLYHEVERMIVEDAPYVFLTAPREFAAMQTTVGGFAFYPDLILRLKNLWVS